jgi:hypothetical protein
VVLIGGAMAKKSKKMKQGKHLTTGKGWRLNHSKSSRRFVATILKVIHIGGERLALVRVWDDLTKEAKKKKASRRGVR